MADFKQAFSTVSSLATTTLNSWAGGSAASPFTSDEVNNSATLYDEILLEIAIVWGSGGSSTTWYDIRVLASIDGGSVFSSPSTPYLVLPALDFGLTSAGSKIYSTRFVAPQRFKIAMWINGTAHTANASGNYIKWQGVYYTGT